MPAGSGPALQNANPAAQTVSRQVQTTSPPQGQSFVRESRKCTQLAFVDSGNAFGGLVARTLKPTPGYLEGFWLVATGSGGNNGTKTVTAGADAPYNLYQNIQLRDAFGTVVYNADGFGAYLIHLYSAQVGAGGLQDPTLDAFYAAIVTGGTPTGTGDFVFALYIPLEFDPDTAYCSLPSMNTAAQMALTIQLNTATAFYGTTTGTPGTTPDIQIACYQAYWAVPLSDPNLAPPDDGSSHQWTMSQASDTISSGGNQRITLPDVGTWISTIICCFRDTLNVRVDTPFAQDLQFWLDGVPVHIEHPNLLFSRMFRQYGLTRPTGVAVYTWRDSVGLVNSIDDMELLLPTTPGTEVELVSGGWGTIIAPPVTVQTYTGKLYPVQNIPARLV